MSDIGPDSFSNVPIPESPDCRDAVRAMLNSISLHLDAQHEILESSKPSKLDVLDTKLVHIAKSGELTGMGNIVSWLLEQINKEDLNQRETQA